MHGARRHSQRWELSQTRYDGRRLYSPTQKTFSTLAVRRLSLFISTADSALDILDLQVRTPEANLANLKCASGYSPTLASHLTAHSASTTTAGYSRGRSLKEWTVYSWKRQVTTRRFLVAPSRKRNKGVVGGMKNSTMVKLCQSTPVHGWVAALPPMLFWLELKWQRTCEHVYDPASDVNEHSPPSLP